MKARLATLPRPLRRVGYWLLYGLFVVAASLAIIWVVFWRPFVAFLRTAEPPVRPTLADGSELDLEVFNAVGWVGVAQPGSFLATLPDKRPGDLRICPFGDSFTKGAEVAPGHDYPTLLQRLLRERGVANVEIVNFGVNAFGVHQSYLLWEYLGERWGCDLVLLGPGAFGAKRDTRFNHMDLRQPYYLHSRFVFSDGGLRRIDVIGTTAEERLAEYFSFFPRLRYLRFDREPPAILRSMMRRDKTVPNPFYYDSRSETDEGFETYVPLLRRMAVRGAPVVVGHPNARVVELAESTGDPNLEGFLVERPLSFPYLAPNGHNSAVGSQLVARQFLRRLIADDSALPFLALDAAKTSGASGGGNAAPKGPVSSLARIGVYADDSLLGVVTKSTRAPSRIDEGSLQDLGAAALLVIHGPEQEMFDGAFVPLETPLPPDPEATLVERRGGRSRPLGPLRTHAGGLVALLELGDVRTLPLEDEQFLVDRCSSEWLQGTDGPVAVRIGDREILTGVPHDRCSVAMTSRTPLHWLRSPEGAFLDLESASDEGELTLRLEEADGGVVRLPLGRWRREWRRLPPLASTERALIDIEGGRARLVPTGRRTGSE